MARVSFYCTYPYDVAFVVGEGLQRLHCEGLNHYHDALAAVSYQTLPTPAVHTGRSVFPEKFAKLSQIISLTSPMQPCCLHVGVQVTLEYAGLASW